MPWLKVTNHLGRSRQKLILGLVCRLLLPESPFTVEHVVVESQVGAEYPILLTISAGARPH